MSYLTSQGVRCTPVGEEDLRFEMKKNLELVGLGCSPQLFMVAHAGYIHNVQIKSGEVFKVSNIILNNHLESIEST